MSPEAEASTSRADGARQTISTVASSPPSSSSNSSTSTINAIGDNAYPRNELTSNIPSSTNATFDLRSRSVSAPASRSSSFSKNLDQLVSLNQSAHRFPIPIPEGRSRSNSGRSIELSSSSQGNSESPYGQRSQSPAFSRNENLNYNDANRPRSTSSVSTPSSPRLSPTLSSNGTFVRPNTIRQFSSESRNSTASRARAALFSPGSGFTPAHENPISSPQLAQTISRDNQGSSNGSNNHSSNPHKNQRRRARSTSATDMNGDQIEGRARANSSSAGSNTSNHSIRSRRARAQSARTSPVLTPNQFPSTIHRNDSENSDGLHASQRTHSVPQLAHYSPVIYSYGFHPCDEQGRLAPNAAAFISAAAAAAASSDINNPTGYFALPPSMTAIANPMNISPREVDELPPPYTPSQPNLAGLNVQLQQQQQGSTVEANFGGSQLTRNPSNAGTGQRVSNEGEEEDEEDSALSFSTNATRTRSTRRRVNGNEERSNGSVQRNENSVNAIRTTNAGIRSEDEGETEREGSIASPSLRSTESFSSPVARNRALEGEPLAEEEWNYIERLERPSKLRQFVLTYLVHPLRLLATIPGIIGTFWLLRNAIVVGWTSGMLWRKPIEGMQPQPSCLEFGLSALYSITTALHALSFTTLLLRRWLHYYSLLPSLIRLIALQALCWPLVRLTLFIMGPRNPLPAWIIISTTTACSDTIARWVVSNITDESDGISDGANGNEDHSSEHLTSSNRNASFGYHKGISGIRRGNTNRFSRRSHPPSSSNAHNKKHQKGGIGMAFWRAIMGAPPRQRSGRLSASLAAAEHGRPHGFITESEAESEVEHVGFSSPRLSSQRHLFQRGSSAIGGQRGESPSINLRRRRFPGNRNGNESLLDYTSEGLTSAGEGEEDDELGELPLLNRANSSSSLTTGNPNLNNNNNNFERVGRIFHWDVAIKRNILPIGILAYMTMWVLLIEDVRFRW